MINDICINNLELNEKEIKEKKLILDSKPLKLGIIVTNKCNLNCIMCPSIRRNGKSTLPKSIFKNIYEILPYLCRIDWQGGEIFLIEYLKDIFQDLIPYKNIEHHITTNGLLLDKEWLNILSELNIRFIFSIDSVIPEIYEYIRKGAKFNILLKKIDLLNEMECSINKKIHKIITVVVMKSNLDGLELFVEFAKKYNFEQIEFLPVNVSGEEDIFTNMTEETRDILNNKMENIKNLARNYNLLIMDKLPINRQTDISNLKIRENISKEIFCILPWKSLWIDVTREGDVFPDCMCLWKVGNIYKDRIINLWNNSQMVNYRRNIIDNKLNFCNNFCTDGLRSQGILYDN